jgi:hypothetical protein
VENTGDRDERRSMRDKVTVQNERRAALRASLLAAMRDPLFLEDLADVERDFRFVHAEIVDTAEPTGLRDIPVESLPEPLAPQPPDNDE